MAVHMKHADKRERKASSRPVLCVQTFCAYFIIKTTSNRTSDENEVKNIETTGKKKQEEMNPNPSTILDL